MASSRGPIALYGATGYTGRLVAAELASSGADFLLSGRSRPRLEALAEELGRHAPVKAASLEDPASLRELLGDCAAVIDCAGPFVRYGEPVLRAAIDTGTHYLDTTGEQRWMDRVFRQFGAEAERRNVAAIPAMGFDYVPGDMLASLTAEGMGKLDQISLAYAWVGFTPTRGTARSALEIAKGGDVEYRDGAWRPPSGGFGRGVFDFGEPIGRQRMIRYPTGEQITVPRHVQTRRVQTTFSAASVSLNPRLAAVTPYLLRPVGLALHTPLARMLDAAISKLPEGPSEKARRAVRFKIVCDALSATTSRRGAITGGDVYGLTAASIARGAEIVASRGFSGRGALAPSQAFNRIEFLAALDRFDVRWELEKPHEKPAAPVGAPA